jgi:hypothetical protein
MSQLSREDHSNYRLYNLFSVFNMLLLDGNSLTACKASGSYLSGIHAPGARV